DPRFRLGILLSIASTWSWAFGTIYTKKHAAFFNPYFGLGLQMLISGASLFAVSHITGNFIPFALIPWQSWAAIGYLAVFGSVLSFIAYLYALQNLATEQASLYAYINPVVAVFFGWLLLNEPMSTYMVAGVLITLIGVYLVNRNAIRS
ncbi:MAG TPA: EamA family transporter, partial [Flavisolibacter sp.]|nr:EamA family transporter [Flavisolibacter sp.]